MKIGPQFERGWARITGARVARASATGEWLGQRATRLMLFPFRDEHVELPTPIRVGTKTLDVVDDLTSFTSLSPEQVHALLMRRPENFRSEWLMLPPELREDTWFYLSSRTYLFANAVHVHDTPQLIDAVASAAPTEGRILEFGGGTGNLSLALAAKGFHVDYLELSSLQKDFTRFRVGRYGLETNIRILDWWTPLDPASYDVVCAFDVFEHIPHLPETLEQVVGALVVGGALIESSPFVVTLDNPMHHEDPGFDDLLRGAALELSHVAEDHRVWRKSPR